ncbi:MAG: type II toxin-antitoxin system HicB family antitoxin [Alphaproteobacteria bacterium]
MNGARAYPARFVPDDDGFILVTFRDVPEAHTNARDPASARAMAIDVLATALWFRLRDGQPIPRASRARKGEDLVAIEPAIALKIALIEAAGGRRDAAAHIARGLAIDPKEARRLLDPTGIEEGERLAQALELFGRCAMVTVTERGAA